MRKSLRVQACPRGSFAPTSTSACGGASDHGSADQRAGEKPREPVRRGRMIAWLVARARG
jgi:hypothetical protein